MTKHSIRDRIRVTKTGKIIRRKMGLNHFRAKKSSRQLHRKGDVLVHTTDVRMFKKYGLKP